MLCAIINDNVVTEVSTLSDEQFAELSRVNQLIIDIGDTFPTPEVGWLFDGTKLVSNGAVEWKITKLALRQRFTIPELSAFYAACPSVILFQIILDNLKVASYIDLKRADTVQVIGTILVQAGILTQERADIILNTEPTSEEVYRGN